MKTIAIFIHFRYKITKRSNNLMAIVPLTFVLGYCADLAYGSKLHRIQGLFRKNITSYWINMLNCNQFSFFFFLIFWLQLRPKWLWKMNPICWNGRQDCQPFPVLIKPVLKLKWIRNYIHYRHESCIALFNQKNYILSVCTCGSHLILIISFPERILFGF